MTRPVHPLFDDLDPELLERTDATAQPDFIHPMLATLHDEPFHREGWIYERKFDGVRLLAFREDGATRLMTRNEKDRSATWFEMLRRAIEWGDPLRFTEHRVEDGVAYWKEACQKGWEGVIAKDGESRYVHRRSRDWLKFKCVNRQELVVGGFTDPEGERKGFGALLLGYHRDDDLVYAGRVGTGFDDETLETDGGKLRHPRFVGLRHDKAAEDVVRERPASQEGSG